MSITERLKGAGMGAMGLAIAAAVIVVPVALLFGAAWISAKVFPWLMPVFFWTLAACVLILTPAALLRPTRGFSAMGFFLASYVFGAIMWSWSLLLTLDLWGMFAVVVGLLIAGVGIVPVAFLAALFHADWASMGDLVIMVVATFGSRILGAWLATKADRDSRYLLSAPRVSQMDRISD